MKVYVITGSTGEYSDNYEWVVGILTNEETARNFVDFMRNKLENSSNMSIRGRDILIDELREFDPKISIDYTGTDYEYEEYELDTIGKIG